MTNVGTCRCGRVADVRDGKVQPHPDWTERPCPGAGSKPRGQLAAVPGPLQLAAFPVGTPGQLQL